MNKVLLTIKFNIKTYKALKISYPRGDSRTIIAFFYLSHVMKSAFERNS